MENKKRLIDANAFREFLEEIRQAYREENTLSSGFAACLIETVQDEYLALAPTVDAVEVVHGRWVNPYMNRYGHPCHCCSVCGFKASYQDKNYCPNCGAKMDGQS